jgi:TonB family protein
MRLWRFGLALAMGAMTVGPAAAQATVDGISGRLVGKVLFLRGLWGGNELSFDADGRPLKQYKPISFTESGIAVNAVKMDAGRLKIEGQRIAISFDEHGALSYIRVPKVKMSIDIAAAPDFSKAIHAVFVAKVTDLIPSMPDFWQAYMTGKPFVAAGVAAGESKTAGDGRQAQDASAGKVDKDKPLRIGGPVKAPRTLQESEPKYPESARALNVSANIQVYLWLDADGTPSHFRILRPVGLGFEEAAIAALRDFKFAPATLNGKPVKVDLYIDVRFQNP